MKGKRRIGGPVVARTKEKQKKEAVAGGQTKSKAVASLVPVGRRKGLAWPKGSSPVGPLITAAATVGAERVLRGTSDLPMKVLEGLIGAATALAAGILDKGCILDEDELAIVLALKRSDVGMSVDELEGRLCFLGKTLAPTRIETILNKLSAFPRKRRKPVQLVEKDSSGLWFSTC